eukprot:TRINITY_DN12873_c0_g1_i1.p1 TRINITY_DN12873_c0_g1~~TRINITY_DN12873_c0_g1_i1.p1  ORF type:complete len:380 (-),score=81.39 TRINITY_DN12873_c0_g1_i1:257-1396(-)
MESSLSQTGSEQIKHDAEMAWIEKLRDANCSCLIRIKNTTNNILFRTDFVLESGMWRKFPQETISPGKHIVFGSESYGFCTGTGGYVAFSMAGVSQPFKMSWSVPFFGSPSTTVSSPESFRIGRNEFLHSTASTVEFSIHDPYEGDYRHSEKHVPLVVEVPKVYETWKYLLKKATQGILITITNTTTHTLILVNCETESGVWSLSPPTTVTPGMTCDFGAQSHGISGSEGWFLYKIQLEKKVNERIKLSDEEEEEEHVFGESQKNEEPEISGENEPKEYFITFRWQIPIFGSPHYSSNLFTVVPKLIGDQSEVEVRFTCDELFAIQVVGDDVNINADLHQRSRVTSPLLLSRDQPNTQTVMEGALLSNLQKRTSYGFES